MEKLINNTTHMRIWGKRMIKKGLAVAVILLFIGVAFAPTFSSSVTPSTTITYDGSLSGYVKNTNMDPIDGARVRVYFHGTYEEDYTDSSGYYHVTDIPICYCLKNATASKVGYETEWILLSITENTTHDFVLTPVDPIPDLDCDGYIDITDVEPGSTVFGEFTVENVGDPESLLDWEIESTPDWGTWTFDPESGTGLTPEDGPLTIQVEVIFPEENFEPYGCVKIVNSEDPDDFCTIEIVIPGPPPEFWHTFIGFIDNPIFSNESITFHADVVFVFWTIIPTKPIFNEQISLPNEYRGFIGDNFIFARFYY